MRSISRSSSASARPAQAGRSGRRCALAASTSRSSVFSPPPRRHGRRARRGPRDAVLARRQRSGALADGRAAGGDRGARADPALVRTASTRSPAPRSTRVGPMSSTPRRASSSRRRACSCTSRPTRCGGSSRRAPRGSRAAGSSSMPSRAGSANAARRASSVARRLAAAALDVVDGRRTSGGSCASCRTSASCASCGSRVDAGRCSVTSPGLARVPGLRLRVLLDHARGLRPRAGYAS